MNKLTKLFVAMMFMMIIPMKSFAQPTRIADNELTISFDITTIANFDERIFFLYNLTTDGRFEVITSENDGIFVVSANEAFENMNLAETFADFREQNAIDFLGMDKVQAAETAAEYKGMLPHEFASSLMMDYYIRSRQNNTCANADPFCTDNGMYQFPAGVNAGSGETGPYYDCLYTTPNPAWYYMQIDNPGNIDIYMYSTPSHDIDFCCWGPYPTITNPSPCSSLTANKVVSCSYSAQATEHCLIPASAQTGDYFILVITNYSNQSCNISFSKVAGTGTTNCGILPPLVDNAGPYCVGETINLTANGQAGASYSWTGPGGFTSNLQNPTRPNCTMAMAGTYTCTISLGGQTNSATTDVVVYPQPNANFTFTTVCQGEATQFTNTSTTNPAGQQISSYQWNFGDGQTSTQQSPSHTYANAGTYTVTLTVNTGGHCTSTKTQTVTVYAQPVANAGPDQTIAYGGTAQLSGSGGSGTYNFHWEPANMVSNPNAQNTQTVSLTQDQTYTLTVTNPQGGCSSTDEVTIHISGSAMTVTAGPNISICQGGSGQIYVNAGGGTGNISYSWTPTTGLSNPNIYNPIASPSQTTTYTCTVNDGQTTQSVSVTVTVNDVIVENESMTICPDDVYPWHGDAYSEVGTYQFDTVTDQGCEKTIYLHLDHYPTYNETTIDTAICYGDSLNFYGTSYSTPGYHEVPYIDHTIHGCDSIVTLKLTVWEPNDPENVPIPLCPDQLPYIYEEDPNQIPLYEGLHIFHPVDEHGCERTVCIDIQVSDYYQPPMEQKYVCELPYEWVIRDADNSLLTTKTIESAGSYIDTIQTAACQGIFKLELYYQPTPETIVEDTVVCDSYPWPVSGQTYDQSDTYHFSVPLDPFPCSQEYQLNLTVNHKSVNNSDTFDGIQDHICDVFTYYNPYLGDTLRYSENINTTLNGQTPEGCDYRVHLQINNMQYTPHPVIDCSDLNVPNPHWPITATEFNVNRYTYQVKDEVSDISRWILSECKWDISKASWRIVPNPSGNNPLECMVYAMDWVPDSICLSFKAVNSCSGNEGVIAEYWLHPSFYGVEEQEAYPASVSFIPNPNNGQMRLQFDNLQGDLNIKVYSLTGTLVDAFELKSIEVGQSHEYSMKRLMNGIYFFTISDGKRSVTKKVVVIH